MFSSRALRLVVIVSFLRLTWAGVAPACETHGDSASRTATASHAAHEHHVDNSSGGEGADSSHRSPAPTSVPVCCALASACGGPGIDAVNSGLGGSPVARVRVAATPTLAPDSRIVAPEPPPPKP